jgi:hypothetical protein
LIAKYVKDRSINLENTATVVNLLHIGTGKPREKDSAAQDRMEYNSDALAKWARVIGQFVRKLGTPTPNRKLRTPTPNRVRTEASLAITKPTPMGNTLTVPPNRAAAPTPNLGEFEQRNQF